MPARGGLSAEGEPVASGAPARKRLLVGEDDGLVRDLLRLLLEAEGYAVETAADGREALDRLADGPPPDGIVLDLMMPVLHGWEFRRRQLQDPRLAAVPIVVVSALEGEHRQAEALAAAAGLPWPAAGGENRTENQEKTRRGGFGRPVSVQGATAGPLGDGRRQPAARCRGQTRRKGEAFPPPAPPGRRADANRQ